MTGVGQLDFDTSRSGCIIGITLALPFTIAPPFVPLTPTDCTLARRSLGEAGKLACYLMRAPVNLSRLRFDRGSGLLVYEPKAGPKLDDHALTDSLELLARVLIHAPTPTSISSISTALTPIESAYPFATMTQSPNRSTPARHLELSPRNGGSSSTASTKWTL
jgi:hypothetical protein